MRFHLRYLWTSFLSLGCPKEIVFVSITHFYSSLIHELKMAAEVLAGLSTGLRSYTGDFCCARSSCSVAKSTQSFLYDVIFLKRSSPKKKRKLNEPYLEFNFHNGSKFGTKWALWINNQCFSPEKTTENIKSPASHYSLRVSSQEKTSDIEMRRQE